MHTCQAGLSLLGPISPYEYKQLLMSLGGYTEQQAGRIIAKLLKEQAK